MGKVTSAVYSPRLEKNIALAMVAVAHASLDTELEVAMPDGQRLGRVVQKPFYDPKKKITSAAVTTGPGSDGV